jgi:hypothetical protein
MWENLFNCRQHSTRLSAFPDVVNQDFSNSDTKIHFQILRIFDLSIKLFNINLFIYYTTEFDHYSLFGIFPLKLLFL